MSDDNKMLIDAAHPEETRVVVLKNGRVEEFDFESAARKLLRGNIYLAKVTRVEPSLQASFIDYGGNRHGFLAFNEIHPDYYQIPVADRQALLAAEAAAARAARDDEDEPSGNRNRQQRSRRGAKPNRGPRRQSERPAGTELSGDQEAGVEEIIEDIDDIEEPTTIEGGTIISGDDESESAPEGSYVGSDADAEDHAEDVAPAITRASSEGLSPGDLVRTAEAGEFASDAYTGNEPAEQHDHAAHDHGDHHDHHHDDVSAAPAEPHDHIHSHDHGHEHSHEHVHADDDLPLVVADEPAEPVQAGAPSEFGRSRERGRRHGGGRQNRAPRQNGDEEQPYIDAGDGVMADQSGETDVLEEVPERRRRSIRQYKIQEVIKRRQIMLVQVVKEERGNKGAALTTYLSLAGRYTVLMPNTDRGGGISRKITNPVDRKRLKEIAGELEVPQGMGLIIRTAGASRSKAEIKRDFEYLMRLWETVRDLTLRSVAPALVYEEGDLIKRSIRDLYTKDIEDVVVAGDAAYHDAKEFMRMLMPSHAKNVKPYKEPEPLFARYQIERQLNGMYSPQVTLKSGGYIVLNQTEALVAIDVNSGKSTREHNIEDTALKTNLEAADEVARQLRLRDLAGLIVIDFIDMEERRNNRNVEKRLKDALKNDRARIQIGRISHFGLLEMSRQRLRTGMLEGSTSQCPHCLGTGMIRSTESVALAVLRAMEDALQSGERRNLTAQTSADAALYLLNAKRNYVQEIENRYHISITILANDKLQGANFTIEKAHHVREDGREVAAAVQVEWGFEAAEPNAPAEADEAAPAPRRNGEGNGQSDGRRRRRGRGGRDGEGSGDRPDDQNGNRGQSRRPAVATEQPRAEAADEPVDDEIIEDAGDADGEGRPDQSGGPDQAGDDAKRSRRRGRRGGRRNRRGGREEGNDRPEVAGSSEANGGSEVDPAPALTYAEAPAMDEPYQRQQQQEEQPHVASYQTWSEPAARIEVIAVAETIVEVLPEPPPPAPEPATPAKRGWWQRKLT